MTKKVLILTQWFDPEPAFKGLLFARELKKRGFEVEVVTGFPNYPGGVLYPGYRIQWRKKEIMEDGISVTRVALYPSHGSSVIGRILNYTTFCFTALAYCILIKEKPDVLYAYHPPLTVGIVAAATRLVRRIPVVYDIQDMWPDTLLATNMIRNRRILQFIGWTANWIYGHVDHIVVLSPGFKQVLIERKLPEEKISIIPNWCDEYSINNPIEMDGFNIPNDYRFKILFAGNMGKAQGLKIIVDSAVVLQQKNIPVVFWMVGNGIEVPNLRNSIKKHGLSNIVLFPAVAVNMIGNYFNRADALLVHLKKDPLFTITIPSKTQAYLLVGKPILMGVEGDAADMVKSAGAGLVFEPENQTSLINAIQCLIAKPVSELDAMSRSGKQYYNRYLSCENGVDAFARVLRQVCDRA